MSLWDELARVQLKVNAKISNQPGKMPPLYSCFLLLPAAFWKGEK